MADLDFIEDSHLRKTLEDSIEFIYVLYERSKEGNQKNLYKEETYRIIILYVAAVIEAVLFYFYKKRGEKIEHLEYKHVQALPREFIHSSKKDCVLVVAVQEKSVKKEYDIGLHGLVNFFRDKKLIREDTTRKILELNDLRNTFHLAKERNKDCNTERVNEALDLLLHTIENAQKTLAEK